MNSTLKKLRKLVSNSNLYFYDLFRKRVEVAKKKLV